MAKTSKAFNIVVVHELMRCYTLSFEIANSDSARQYIQSGATFICDGQAYDIQSFKKHSGSDGNTTQVGAFHVGYRLGNYKLPAGYSFVGTAAQIAQDILNQSINNSGLPASSEFEVGTVPDLGTISFSLENTDEVTARYAILALKNIGAEMDFSNFTINFAEQIGGGQTQTFEFGVNMDNVEIAYDKSNGTTYSISIADLQVLNQLDHPFDIGWYVNVSDYTTGESFTKRIITYTRCLDDPSKNSITLGVFVSDIATQTAQMSIKLDASVQQGETYSNVSIDHTNGFMATLDDGTHTQMNGNGVTSTHTDGSYTTLDGDGLKHHNGATSEDYHYLSESGTITITQDQYYTNLDIPLPSKFKDKEFKISLSLGQYDGGGESLDMLNVYISRKDKSTPLFTVYAYAPFGSFGGGFLSLSYFVIA